MIKNKQGFSAVALVIIIAVLAIGGYAVWQKQDNSLSTPSVDTTNWKTYRNDKYGFEFKYPNEWHLAINNEVSLNSIFLSPEEINFPSVWDSQLTPIEAYIESAEQYKNSLKIWEESTDYENITGEIISSFGGEKLGQKFEGVDRSSQDIYSYGLFVSEAYLNLKSSDVLSFRYQSSSGKLNDAYDIYNKILSTFRFVK